MAYGTKIRDHKTLQAAAEAAVGRAYWPRGGNDPTDPVGFVYRVDAVSYAQTDEWGDNWTSTGPILELEAYAVRRWTPCGATLFLESRFGRAKWCNFRSTKQFACRTIEEACESFRQRRVSQIRRLQGQLSRAGVELDMIEQAMGLKTCSAFPS